MQNNLKALLNPILLEVIIHINSNFRGYLFTGKLVKSILLDANPKLKPLFTKTKGITPKLIHITPLFRAENGKIKCIYSEAKRNGKEAKTLIPVTVNGTYTFYIGFIEHTNLEVFRSILTFEEIYNTLLDISGIHTFRKTRFKVELLSINIVNVYRQSSILAENTIKKGKIRIIFASPTLLRDPLRTSKYKSLIASPLNIFSTPVFIHLYVKGTYSKKKYMKRLLIMHRLLNEPYSIHSTLHVKWIYYERKPIPALVGYVNLHLNRDYYEVYDKKYNIYELLKTIYTYMLTLGTGTSRATGFGHIVMKVVEKENEILS